MLVFFTVLLVLYLAVALSFCVASLLYCDKEDVRKSIVIGFFPVYHLFPLISMIKSGCGFNKVMSYYVFYFFEPFYTFGLLESDINVDELVSYYEDFLKKNRQKREVHHR